MDDMRSYADWAREINKLIAQDKRPLNEIARAAGTTWPTIKKIRVGVERVSPSTIRAVSEALAMPRPWVERVIDRMQDSRERVIKALDRHLANHVHCVRCGGTGEIDDDAPNGPGVRLCEQARTE